MCATKVSWAMTAARNTASKDAAAMVFAPMANVFVSQDFQARRARSAVARQASKAPFALATEHAVMERARARMAILAKTAWPISVLKVACMGNALEENACVNVVSEVLTAPSKVALTTVVRTAIATRALASASLVLLAKIAVSLLAGQISAADTASAVVDNVNAKRHGVVTIVLTGLVRI